jgi:tRNA G18 (ribose-2'-O)-methylase SpoU
MFQGPSIVDLARTASGIITLSPKGVDIRKFKFPESFCLLPGIEGPGLPPELRHLKSLSIPMERGVESLNATLATGIAFYVWRSQSQEKGKRNDGIME